jgi:hypothetical protein
MTITIAYSQTQIVLKCAKVTTKLGLYIILNLLLQVLVSDTIFILKTYILRWDFKDYSVWHLYVKQQTT